MEELNLHASLVDFNGKGVLIIGESGAGKSDLALRLIGVGAKLVADDRVILTAIKGELIATSHPLIKGMLEVRGLGIVKMDFIEETKIKLVVELKNKEERSPDKENTEFLGIKIPLLKINPFFASSVLKVKLAIGQTL